MSARAIAVVLLAATMTVGCGRDDPPVSGAVPPAAGASPRTVFVLVGGDESDAPPGFGSITRAWEQVIYSSMPPSTVLVDLADRRPTARAVVREQLPKAQALHPTVATVWLGAEDAEINTSVDTFSDYLEQIVTGLQEAGAKSVLLLSRRSPSGAPAPLDESAPLPAGGAADTGTTEPDERPAEARYDEAIDAIAARTGAKVVPLRPGHLTQEYLAATVGPHVVP